MQFLPTFEFGWPALLFISFAALSLVQLIYTLFIFGRLAFLRAKPRLENKDLPPISILVAARNEADNLFENLPALLEQDYPQFEVIVINHQSTDESTYLLSAFERQYKHLKIIEVAKSKHLRSGKKLPLTLGVKGASYEHLLFTDADCKPASNKWLHSMASHFTPGKEIVLGYGPLTYRKGILNKLARFDTAWIAMSYFSMALSRIPYMGVGRNMAYTKTLFNSVNGFKSHYAIPSGDDDLFIQQAAHKRNYTVNLDPHAFTYSESSKDWGAWLRQKTRHYSTSNQYKVIKKALLGIYPLSLLLQLLFFVILLSNTDYNWITLAVYFFVLILKWWIQGRCFLKLKEKRFIPALPLWEVFYAILVPIIYYSVETKAPNKW
jgi:cellulose synthase/poly-beta-1,6-N-acetylglucosamine synthase-like glycosyltransferase